MQKPKKKKRKKKKLYLRESFSLRSKVQKINRFQFGVRSIFGERFQNVQPSLCAGQADENLVVKPTRAEQCRV
jgi:hypothetical protein